MALEQTAEAGRDFVRDIVQADLETGRHKSVVTRFPPEPNGYLHIGHAKSIALNFGIAQEFGGRCHLRFDDTNPTREEQEYIDAIKEDVHWLGFDWGENLFHASDYFEQPMTTLAPAATARAKAASQSSAQRWIFTEVPLSPFGDFTDPNPGISSAR